MEPVTHVLTGACLARAGCNRKAAYATPLMALAAEFPDIDALWGFRGPVAAFRHHRGITHTFLAVPLEAALLVGIAFAVHRWRVRRSARAGAAGPATAAPVRWGALYGFVILALLSHILLDFTNNYGVRPFFPFNPHWYAASIVFIFDPLLFGILLLALGLPSLFRLVNAEVGARRERFSGRLLAQSALVLIGLYYLGREFAHAQAVQSAMAESVALPSRETAEQGLAGEADSTAPPSFVTPQRVLASPDPLSPFRWYMAMDFGPFLKLGTADLHNGTVVLEDTPLWKQPRTPALLAAFRSDVGRAYLDWSPMPLITVEQAEANALGPEQPSPAPFTTVTFMDPRFLGDLPLLGNRRMPPLTGVVTLDRRNQVIAQAFDGKPAPRSSGAR